MGHVEAALAGFGVGMLKLNLLVSDLDEVLAAFEAINQDRVSSRQKQYNN